MSRSTAPLTAALLLVAPVAFADAPPVVPVSGFVADEAGAGLEGPHEITLNFYDSAGGGTPIFSDTVSVDVEAGFFTAYAGENEALDLALFADEDEVHLGLQVDGGSELTPLIRLATAPWAGYAARAGIADVAEDADALQGLLPEDLRQTADPVPWADVAEPPQVLGTTPCADNEVLSYDLATTTWVCGSTGEADPVFASSDAAGIVATDIGNWNTAFGWGDHSAAGYLAASTWTASAASAITTTDTGNWNTAFGWGDHSAAGYLAASTWTASAASTITPTNTGNWNTAFGWGDHSAAGYLAASTWTASAASAITATDTGNWNTAFGWGDHGTAGYVDETGDTMTGALTISTASLDLSLFNTAESEAGIRLADSGSAAAQFADITYDNAGSTRELNFSVDSATPLMTLNTNQRAGLRTETPSAVLDIEAGSTEGLEVNYSGSSDAVDINHTGAGGQALDVTGDVRLAFNTGTMTDQNLVLDNATETLSGIRMRDSQALSTQFAEIQYDAAANDLQFRVDSTTAVMTIDNADVDIAGELTMGPYTAQTAQVNSLWRGWVQKVVQTSSTTSGEILAYSSAANGGGTPPYDLTLQRDGTGTGMQIVSTASSQSGSYACTYVHNDGTFGESHGNVAAGATVVVVPNSANAVRVDCMFGRLNLVDAGYVTHVEVARRHPHVSFHGFLKSNLVQ